VVVINNLVPMKRRRGLRAGVFFAALLTPMIIAAPAFATYSVVGADPATGEIGVAISSCVPVEVAFAPVLVPGKGAAVAQANPNQDSGPEIVKLLDGGATAEQVIAGLTAGSFDPIPGERQYGVVTSKTGAQAMSAAGYSGADNLAASLNVENASGGVSAQGNTLVSNQVAQDMAKAFEATDGPLAQKLLAGLKAGSAAGGDSRCGAQTSNAAALLVAKPTDAVYQHTNEVGKSIGTSGASLPSTYGSVLLKEGGANPVAELTSRYQAAAASGQPVNFTYLEPGSGYSFGMKILMVALANFVFVLAAVIILVALLVYWLVRRRRKRKSASEPTPPAERS